MILWLYHFYCQFLAYTRKKFQLDDIAVSWLKYYFTEVFDFHTKFKCFLHKGDCVFLEALIKDNRF